MIDRLAKPVMVLCCLVASGAGQALTNPVPGDFKILVSGYGLAKEPVYTEEMVAISGRVYEFASNTKEVVVIEPARSIVALIDLDRKIQSELTFDELDRGLERIRKALGDTTERLAKTGKRADAVEAQMTRDLVAPRFSTATDAGPRKIRLTNPTVEVVAEGEDESDASRLGLIGFALDSIIKLGAFRTPNDLPPFVELDAIGSLTRSRKLRPTELSYLYRLAGPPRRFRRTYRTVLNLSERDREAIRRIDQFREAAPMVRYEKYKGGR